MEAQSSHEPRAVEAKSEPPRRSTRPASPGLFSIFRGFWNGGSSGRKISHARSLIYPTAKTRQGRPIHALASRSRIATTRAVDFADSASLVPGLTDIDDEPPLEVPILNRQTSNARIEMWGYATIPVRATRITIRACFIRVHPHWRLP